MHMLNEKFEFPNDVNFVCSKCASCCGDTEDTVRHVLLLETESEKIAKQTSQDIQAFAKEVFGFEPYCYEMKKTETDGKCLFLKDNRCTIYEIRPIICKFYPFELKNLGNENYLFSYTTKCPGMGKGSGLEREFFDQLFKVATYAMDNDSRPE